MQYYNGPINKIIWLNINNSFLKPYFYLSGINSCLFIALLTAAALDGRLRRFTLTPISSTDVKDILNLDNLLPSDNPGVKNNSDRDVWQDKVF